MLRLSMRRRAFIVPILLGLLVLLVLFIIYRLSAQTATESSQLSKNLARNTIAIYTKITRHEIELRQWEHLLRKSAHFTLYSFLALLTMGFCLISRLRIGISALLSLLLCIIFAIGDELHQLYVDGRGASLQDVGIDSAGAVLGIVIMYLLNQTLSRLRE